jgi:short-subunit dehydrogenase
MLGVNLGGVVNGLVTFLPRILKHGEEGHVISTSSSNGIFAVDGTGLYCAGKFAVAGIMETLAADLKNTPVGASAFFPGPIASNLGVSSQECRPDHLKNEAEPAGPPKGMRMPFDPKEYFMDPVEAGERVLEGILRKDLFIITHPEFKEGIIARNKALLRAIPDEAPDAKRHELLKRFGTLLYNPIYDGQKQVGPFKGNRKDSKP